MTRAVRLLHLEDSSVDHELIIATLEGGGFEIESRHATTRDEYLQALDSGEAEVILADCKLPSFDGLAALALARERRPEIPFIFVSGFIGEEAALESLKHGATDYVFKHNLARLAPAVRRALQEAREQQERRRTEAALQEREGTLASFFDTAPFMMGIVELLPDDDLLHHSDNAASARFLGTTPAAMRRRRTSELGFPRDLIPKWVEQFREARRLGGPVDAEHAFTLNGQARWMSITVNVVPAASGRSSRFCYVATDITDKKQLEQQFLRAQRLESVGTLASGIAHDLNNVLAPIVMSLRLFRSKLTSPEDREVLASMESSARRGADVIRQVLAFARGVDGVRQPLSVETVIADLTKILRDTCPRSIQVESEIAPNLATVNGDATQIYQVLMNLCVNARDAMPLGGLLRLSAKNCAAGAPEMQCCPGASPGDWVLINVSDTGIGVAPAILDKIFDPFFTTKSSSFGTGLGLSTALSIVKSHGGFMTVESTVGEGTVFKICLPAHDAKPTVTVPAPAVVPPRGNGELVLVVDDELAMRQVTRATLLDHGYRVLCVTDGREACALFSGEQQPIRLVITDMMMPSMDGSALVKALRELQPGLKVIAMSGLLNSQSMMENTGWAASAFLQKPFTAERLLEAVANAVR
ncbi:MAG: two-component system, cell cycle sensor histidine kinase and response regulator CckA [Verrucomicrobiota bacterium]|jgi:PAS domain S-box-containing protein